MNPISCVLLPYLPQASAIYYMVVLAELRCESMVAMSPPGRMSTTEYHQYKRLIKLTDITDRYLTIAIE